MDNSKVVIGKQQPIDVCRQLDPLIRGAVLGDECGLAARASTRPAHEPEHAIVSDNSLLRMLTPAPTVRPRTAPGERPPGFFPMTSSIFSCIRLDVVVVEDCNRTAILALVVALPLANCCCGVNHCCC